MQMSEEQQKRWDVFISHADEDKDDFVRPLAEELRLRGLEVWYDEFSLRLGVSLNKSINKGLSKSEFGIVVLSPHFFKKSWPQWELAALVAREVEDGKVILPIWHGVTHSDVVREAPILADRIAVDSSRGLVYVVEQVFETIQPVSSEARLLTERTLEAFLHDLLHPIAALRYLTEFVKHRFPLEDQIERRLQDMEALTHYVEVTAKTGLTTKVPGSLTKRKIDVNIILHNVLISLRSLAAQNKIDVRLAVDDGTFVLADQHYLYLVFYHVLRNAIKYFDFKEEMRWITVSTLRKPQMLEILFTDNGIGIQAGEEEVIFREFTRGRNAVSVSVEGMGRGLAFCRKVLRLQDGYIRLQRQHMRKPTVFVIGIPEYTDQHA